MAYGNVNVAVPGVSNDESSYLKTEQAGAPGGVATLDADGKLSESQRPTVDAYTKAQTDQNISTAVDAHNSADTAHGDIRASVAAITWQRNPWKPPLWPVSVRRGRTSVMTDEELEHRLTAVENRAQSNTHRLDELGKLTDAVNGMNTNIKLTIQQLENTNKSLEIVTAQNKKQEDRLTALEKAPGTFGNKLWWAVIAALVSGLVAYELTMLLH